jgi:uncharacterized membrane protein
LRAVDPDHFALGCGLSVFVGCCVQAEYKKALDSAFIRATGPARILNYKQKVCVTMSATQPLALLMLCAASAGPCFVLSQLDLQPSLIKCTLWVRYVP